MNNKPALAIVKNNGRTTTGVLFDQETIEFKRLNDKVQARKDAQSAAAEARYRERQRRRDYEWFCTLSMGHLIARGMILLLTGIWTADGIIPMWLSALIGVYCIGSVLIRVGRWIEKAKNQ